MRILKDVNLNDVVFLDIETVRITDTLEKDTPLYDSWEYKMRYSAEASKFEEAPMEHLFKEKAALYAEFAKIVCITIGKIVDNKKIALKSYYNHDEKQLLSDFIRGYNSLLASNSNIVLAGHAIKGFDIPFIMRRCVVNKLEIPLSFDVAHLKPWEVKVYDTKDLWQGAGWYAASLLNISTALGLPSPKSDINGSECSDVYYSEGDEGLERIKNYCERDVETVANVFLILKGEEPILDTEGQLETKEVGLLEKMYNTKSSSKEDVKLLNNTIKKLSSKEQKIAEDILNIINDKS